MHEMRFRSLGGKVSKRNSIWVCGDGVSGCHGLMQQNQIVCDFREIGAEGVVQFIPRTAKAREWLKLKEDQRMESGPMSIYEDQ